MNRIVCGLCRGVKREEGCYSCGGYGYMAERRTLDCGCETWLRPGQFTMYDGKRFTSYSGAVIVVHLSKDFKTTYKCSHCEEKK